MTGIQLLDNALALLMTSSTITTEYSAFALPLVNLLLAETAPYNEMICRAKEKESATEMAIEHLTDELPCEPEIAALVLPYGLCAKFLVDDDDMAKVAWFSNQYVAAAEACASAVGEPIRDCYPKGAAE